MRNLFALECHAMRTITRKLILLITLIFLALLASDLYPGLRGGSGWRWPYLLPDNWTGALLLGILLIVYLVGVFLLRRWQVRTWAVLAWVFISAAVLGVAVVGVHGDAGFLLFTRTVSPVQTGASALAVRVMAEEGAQSTLERWPDVMRESQDTNLIHFTTSPPGQPLLHDVLARIFDPLPVSRPLSAAVRLYQCADYQVMRYTRGELVSAIFGMLMPLWAALAVFPLYSAARMLGIAALDVVVWWPLMPTVLLFAPTWNTLYPFLAILAFAFLLTGLRRRGIGFALGCVAAGGVMSITTFLNFAVLPLLLLFGLFTLGAGWVIHANRQDKLTTRLANTLVWSFRAGLWFALGLSSVWILYFASTGLAPLDLLRVTFDNHSDLVQRDYLPWLILHPYDVLMFVGWPVAILFLAASVKQLAEDLTQRREERKVSQSTEETKEMGLVGSDLSIAPAGDTHRYVPTLIAATFFTFLLVDLSGIAQGENARILSYYAPFFLLCAGIWMARHDFRWKMPLLMAQALTVLVMAIVLPVVPQDLNPQAIQPREDVPAFDFLTLQPVDAIYTSPIYDGEFRLEAYRFVADVAQQAISLETHWEGIAPTERPYHFEVIASAENAIDGEIITAPYQWLPQSGNYLTTCWRSGDSVRDVTIIPLPTISAPVVWSLALRAVDERTGDVMTVMLVDGTSADSVNLGPVNYP